MYIGVKTVKPLPDYRLQLTFDDGQMKIFDMRGCLDIGIFQELRDESLFNTVRVNFDTVEWANGADLCPETLYAESIAAVRNSQ